MSYKILPSYKHCIYMFRIYVMKNTAGDEQNRHGIKNSLGIGYSKSDSIDPRFEDIMDIACIRANIDKTVALSMISNEKHANILGW